MGEVFKWAFFDGGLPILLYMNIRLTSVYTYLVYVKCDKSFIYLSFK